MKNHRMKKETLKEVQILYQKMRKSELTVGDTTQQEKIWKLKTTIFNKEKTIWTRNELLLLRFRFSLHECNRKLALLLGRTLIALKTKYHRDKRNNT